MLAKTHVRLAEEKKIQDDSHLWRRSWCQRKGTRHRHRRASDGAWPSSVGPSCLYARPYRLKQRRLSPSQSADAALSSQLLCSGIRTDQRRDIGTSKSRTLTARKPRYLIAGTLSLEYPSPLLYAAPPPAPTSHNAKNLLLRLLSQIFYTPSVAEVY